VAKVAGMVEKVPMENWETWVISTNTYWARLPDQESGL